MKTQWLIHYDGGRIKALIESSLPYKDYESFIYGTLIVTNDKESIPQFLIKDGWLYDEQCGDKQVSLEDLNTLWLEFL